MAGKMAGIGWHIKNLAGAALDGAGSSKGLGPTKGANKIAGKYVSGLGPTDAELMIEDEINRKSETGGLDFGWGRKR